MDTNQPQFIIAHAGYARNVRSDEQIPLYEVYERHSDGTYWPATRLPRNVPQKLADALDVYKAACER